MIRRALAIALILALTLAPATDAKRKVRLALDVAPATVHVGDEYTVTGTAPVWADGVGRVTLADPGCCRAFAVTVTDGTFIFHAIAESPGTYTVNAIGTDDLGHLIVTDTQSFEVVR